MPAILIWYEIVLSNQKGERAHSALWQRLLAVSTHVAVGLGFLWFRWDAVHSLIPSGLGSGGIWQRLPGSFDILGRHTILAIWPFRMQLAYVHPRAEAFLDGWPLVGLAIATLCVTILVAWIRRWPAAAFALGWYLITMAPITDLSPLAPRSVNMADRYLFIPSLGICWLLGLTGVRLWDHARAWSRQTITVLGVAATGILLAWTWSTLGHAAVWRDNITLFSSAVRTLTGCAFCYNNLGLALVRARAHIAVEEWDAAQRVLTRGLEHLPDLAEAHLSLGYVLERQGKPRDAIAAYRRALALRGDLVWAYVGLARTQLQLGDARAAASAARTALGMAPENLEAARILGEPEAGGEDLRPYPGSRQP